MIRQEEFRTPIGQKAWVFYKTFLHKKHKYSVNVEAFLNSALYTSFIRFAKYVEEVDLPNPKEFIDLMIEHDYFPSMWTSTEVYSRYIQEYDTRVEPKQQVIETLKVIDSICKEKGVDSSEIFNVITPNTIIKLLRQKNISPWILLKSPKFISFYKNKFPGEQKAIFASLVNFGTWTRIFQDNLKFVDHVREVIKELGI